MKIRLKSFYGDQVPGNIVEADDAEGERLISVGGGVLYVPTDEEKAAEEAAAKAAAEVAAKKQAKTQ